MIELEQISGYAITWFTMSLVTAGIAQGKNRGGFNWWLLSMLLTPPVALFFLVVFSDTPSHKHECNCGAEEEE